MERSAIALDEMSAEAFTPAARGEGVKAAIVQHSAVLSGYCETGYEDAVHDVATAYEEHTAAYHREVNPDFHIWSVWGELRRVFGLSQRAALDVEARLNQLRWNMKKPPLPKEIQQRYDSIVPH